MLVSAEGDIVDSDEGNESGKGVCNEAWSMLVIMLCREAVATVGRRVAWKAEVVNNDGAPSCWNERRRTPR